MLALRAYKVIFGGSGSKTSLPVRRKTPNFSLRPNPGIATQGGSIRGEHRWLH